MADAQFKSRSWADILEEECDPGSIEGPSETPSRRGAAESRPGGVSASRGGLAPGPISVVMRSIPARCTLQDVIATVYYSGFQGAFEYAYLAVKDNRRQNKGQVLFRFAHAQLACAFCHAVDGCRVIGRGSGKAINVTLSQVDVARQSLVGLADQVVYDEWHCLFGAMILGSRLIESR